LSDFFSRPIEIASYSWGTGINLNAVINPWTLFFNNKRVVNRISNYNLLRCKLHVKFVINGNGFQYGRLLAAYLPLHSYDRISAHSALIEEDLVQTSQLPHIFLDPNTSMGGEMVLPFYWHFNNLRVAKDDKDDMGIILLRTLNTLRHANNVPDSSDITVFAWATDVKLSGLTSRNADGMTPQMGYETKSKPMSMKVGAEVNEANAKGVISGPATALAKASMALTAVPQIAPYAMATSKVAGTVASLAKVLGYSRPSVTKNPEPVRPVVGSQMATTTTPDTAIKLTVDDMQELTIDPAVAGLGPEDTMIIKNIAKRETYFNKFTWAYGTGRNTLLQNYNVQPCLWRERNVGPAGQTAFFFPACAMAALPFKYWTGTMKFRFQIVASVFHKGRIRITYEPNRMFTGSMEYNTNFVEVVDISETKDFTIEVGNGQRQTLLRHPKFPDQQASQLYGNIDLPERPGNGILAIHVLNELTTPGATAGGTNDIEINVFISMGDDFEVFVPVDSFKHYSSAPALSSFKQQSGLEAMVAPNTDATNLPSAPEQTDVHHLGPGVQDTDNTNKVFTGESIVSFRAMLKRYTLWRREAGSYSSVTGYKHVTRTMCNFPFYKGAVPGAIDPAVGENYNFCNTLLLHWVVLAHAGWRGSIRYKVLDKNLTDRGEGDVFYVERTSYQANAVTTDSAIASDKRSVHAAAIMPADYPIMGAKGMTYSANVVNPTLEFEVPWYSEARFEPGKIHNYTTTALGSPIATENFVMVNSGYMTSVTHQDFFVATGEDFQCYFWTGLPRLYWDGIPPAPA
jgi:hypothetical protein